MVRATKVLLDGYGVPESLRWHQGALYFVDMAAGTLHRWTEAGGEDVLRTIPGRAGGLGFLPNGDMPVSYTHLTLPTTLHECRSRWSPYQ